MSSLLSSLSSASCAVAATYASCDAGVMAYACRGYDAIGLVGVDAVISYAGMDVGDVSDMLEGVAMMSSSPGDVEVVWLRDRSDGDVRDVTEGWKA